MAIEEDRALLTQDKDMGQIYYFSNRNYLEIIVLRPRIQTVHNIRKILERFLPEIGEREEKALYTVDETGYRVLR